MEMGRHPRASPPFVTTGLSLFPPQPHPGSILEGTNSLSMEGTFIPRAFWEGEGDRKI